MDTNIKWDYFISYYHEMQAVQIPSKYRNTECINETVPQKVVHCSALITEEADKAYM